LSTECAAKAWQLRERASDREKFFIDFTYDRQVTGNLEKAYQTLELWRQTYPRNDGPPSPYDLLGGLATQGTGRFERGIEISQAEIATHPDVVWGYSNLVFNCFFADRFPEAESTIQLASERKIGGANLQAVRYKIALLRGDQNEMDGVVALAKGKRGAEHRLAHAQAKRIRIVK
jgi:eukaryotic-like serine/threonine-protein kinase